MNLLKKNNFLKYFIIFFILISIFLDSNYNICFSKDNFEIDGIELNGVRPEFQEKIEVALEITPGDPLERSKIVQSEKKLLDVYSYYGYGEAKVKTSFVKKKNSQGIFENFIKFDVIEGLPNLVNKIYFKISSQNKEIQSVEESKKKTFRSLIELKQGDSINQEKLSDGIRAIQDFLANEGYVGIKILPFIIHPSSNVHLKDSLKQKNGHWIDIEVPLTLGERVDFGFRGNQFLSKGQLNDFVKEQRLLGLGVNYVQAIKKKIIEEYKSFGFDRVEVDISSIENSKSSRAINGYDRIISYLIKEGPRVKIQSISFDGQIVLKEKELLETLFRRGSKQIQNRFYVLKDLKNAADLVLESMKEQGYLGAKIIHLSVIAPPLPRSQVPGSKVDIKIYIYEGEQTIVQSFQVHGSKAISEEQIRKTLKINVDEAINLFAFEEGLENLKAIYKNEGYLDFKILNEGSDQVVIYSGDRRTADIQLILEEGEQFLVSEIDIEGLNHTKPFIVEREIKFKKEEILHQYLVNETEQQLRRLGIFSQVSIRYLDDPHRFGYKIVKIVVEEADRGSLSWGPGVRNDLGIRLFSQLSFLNIWGENHSVSLTGSVNRRFYNYHFGEAQIQISYSWPWFIFPKLAFKPSISIGKIQYLNFAANNLTLTTFWEKTLVSNPKLVGSFSYSFEKIEQFNAPQPTSIHEVNDNQRLQIGTVTPKLSLDLRDDPLLPTKGFYFVTWADYVSRYFAAQVSPPLSYYRAQFRGDYHLPLGGDIGFYFSFRTGFEKNLIPGRENENGKSSIPLSKQFALGGIGSLRGYQEQQLNVNTLNASNSSFEVSNSLSYINYRAEIIFPFSGSLKVATFLDAANLLIYDYYFQKFLYSSGFGLRYLTPVGAANLDLGFKMNPPANMDAYVLHFSLGVI